MGEEEKKEEEKKKDEEKEEKKKKEEEKEKEIPQDVLLKVDMHCGACARKVARSLRGFQGVEQVITDCKASKVVVKGKELDPLKVGERIQKKSGRKVEIISPLPKPPDPNVEKKQQEPEPPKEEKKNKPPPSITVVLKISMHCDACAQGLHRRIRKIPGVESVKTDLANEQVMVTGVVDPEKLVKDVYKRTRKQASIVVKEEEKKEEPKKEEDKKEDEKKEEVITEAKSEEDNNTDAKKIEYWPPKYYMEYAHAPQIFSDENPHACSIM